MGPGRLEGGRREEGRELLAVRMTFVGGVREDDETRNYCDGMSAQHLRDDGENLRIPCRCSVTGGVSHQPSVDGFEWFSDHFLGSLITPAAPQPLAEEIIAKTGTLRILHFPAGGARSLRSVWGVGCGMWDVAKDKHSKTSTT